MPFNQQFFAPVAPNSTEAPALWSYSSPDTIADISVADYFDAKKFQLREGDWIYTQASDQSGVVVYRGEGVVSDIINMPAAPEGQVFLATGINWVDARSTQANTLYNWSTDTTASDPGDGYIKANNNDLSLITEIYFNPQKLNSFDSSNIIERLKPGDRITLSRFLVQFNNAIVEVTELPINNGGWYTIPVSVDSASGGFLQDDDLVLDLFEVSLQVPRMVLMGCDMNIQEPTALDTPIQITFGPQQITEDVTLDASGTITINRRGFYRFSYRFEAGRMGGAGGVANLFFRLLINGSQSGESVTALIDNPAIAIPLLVSGEREFQPGDTIETEMYRDSTGMNEGGIYPNFSTLGWNDAPSACVRVARLI